MKTLSKNPHPLFSLFSLAAVLAFVVFPDQVKGQTPILFGQTKADQALVPAQNTPFSFTATAGELVNIRMTEVSGGFYPTFDLLSPTGSLLKTVTHPSSASLALFALPASGSYLIICRDDSGNYGGGYNLTLISCLGENSADNDKGELTPGTTKTATVVPSDMDVFSFSGVAGQLVTVQMTEVSGGFYPTFDLLSPTGSLLSNVTHASSARLALFALSESGTHRIICRDETGNYGGGYNLSLTVLKVDDSDEDGLLDSWEQQYFSSLQYGPEDDPDDDRLKNAEESEKKTNPSKADTDDDSFKDGTEVALGSDPLDPNSKPSTEMRIYVKTVDVEFLTITGFRHQLQASSDTKAWENLGDAMQGDNSLFRTNIDVRGTDFRFFRAPATATP